MGCPYFKPQRKLTGYSGRAPLGALFEGECSVGGACQARLCNFGYARGQCAVFPEGPDAVRFSVAASAKGIVRVIWILEKDHAPVEHGILEYREASGEFAEELQGVLGVQARMFVEDYLSR